MDDNWRFNHSRREDAGLFALGILQAACCWSVHGAAGLRQWRMSMGQPAGWGHRWNYGCIVREELERGSRLIWWRFRVDLEYWRGHGKASGRKRLIQIKLVLHYPKKTLCCTNTYVQMNSFFKFSRETTQGRLRMSNGYVVIIFRSRVS